MYLHAEEPHGAAGVIAALPAERERLVHLCARLSGSPEAAEDLAQETLIEAWRHASTLHEQERRSAWLSGIARNVCRRWARRRGRTMEHAALDAPDLDTWAAPNVDIEIDLERRELAHLLDQALSLLPAATREVLVRRYVDDSPHAEIAARLGLSEGAVKVRLHRGKLALGRLLRERLGEEGVSYGFGQPSDTWQATRIWCPSCGRALLSSYTSVAEHTFIVRCGHCKIEMIDRSATYVDEVRGHRRTLLRSFGQAHTYFRAALAVGEAPCARCGRAARLRLSLPAGLSAAMQRLRGVHVQCDACMAISIQPESGLVLTLPQVRQFWRDHERMRMRPAKHVENEGRAAVVRTFESVTGRATLDVVAAHDTFEIIGVHRTG